ncbi:MAG: C39 family peptidase [Planctomycetota bacterium]
MNTPALPPHLFRSLLLATLALLASCADRSRPTPTGNAAAPPQDREPSRAEPTTEPIQGWAHAVVADDFGLPAPDAPALSAPTPERNRRQLPKLRLFRSNANDQTYVARLRTGKDTFRQVVASWNIITTAPVIIEMRVRHADDQTFSPWLRLGHAGPQPSDELPARRAWDRGAVEVDTIVADTDLDAWQYRLHLQTESEADSADIRRVAVVASREAAFNPGDPPAAGTAPLDVAFFSQFDAPQDLAPRLCSPTAAAMALTTLGTPADPLELARAARDPDFNLYGNWPRNVQAAFAHAHNQRTSQDPAAPAVGGYVTRLATWAEADRHLAAGRALVASVAIEPGEIPNAPIDSTPGHLIVIRGFDDNDNANVLVADPAATTSALGLTAYPAAALAEAWFSRRLGTAYVFFPPAG